MPKQRKRERERRFGDRVLVSIEKRLAFNRLPTRGRRLFHPLPSDFEFNLFETNNLSIGTFADPLLNFFGINSIAIPFRSRFDWNEEGASFQPISPVSFLVARARVEQDDIIKHPRRN